MKQLVSLLLLILITAVSWASCAKNKDVNVTTSYSSSYFMTPSLLLTPILATLETNDNLNFSQAKIVNKHNCFFEFSIVFNENLQQVISYFTRPDYQNRDIVNHRVSSYTNNYQKLKPEEK
ncbi:MAG: hypothetical protein JKX76_11370 [Colwellia sp.]|nr:hypothetical protein [Colwellia sp.]